MSGGSGQPSIRKQRELVDQQRHEDFVRWHEAAERRELAGLYEDECTWLAETINGSMRTSFTFRLVDGELTASDGRQLRSVFEKGKEYAQTLAASDTRMQGGVERSEFEWQEFLIMDAMAHDTSLPNTVIVNSPILAGLTADIHGYQASRGLGWQRTIMRNDATGEITITSQSVDGDERQAYNATYTHFEQPTPQEVSNDGMLGERIFLNLTAQEQAELPDTIMGLYDGIMNSLYGGAHRAGRRQENGDTWQFVIQQEDLIRHHLHVIAPLVVRQKQGDRSVDAAINATRYNTAATLRRRYERGQEWTSQFGDVAVEHTAAGAAAAALGEVFNGCGFMAESSETEAAVQLRKLGYGPRPEKVRGACPICKVVVVYDPCDPACTACGATGKDPRPVKKLAGKAAAKAGRTMLRQKVQKADERRVLPNGQELVVRNKLVVGGTSRYYEELGTGRTIEAP
jgi:hypothetical protein